MVVEVSRRKACKGFAVQWVRRNSSGFDDVAFIELELNFACHILLGAFNESLDSLPERSEPFSFIYNLCSFDYIIGDDYNSELKVPKDFEIVEIPKFTWVIFSCIGKSSITIKETNEKIFKEWLPNSNDYEIASGYNIEMYSNPKDYKNGIDDEKYYCEIWIPIKKK